MKMKNHKFNDAMDIFAKMFEGWSMVTNKCCTYPITSANPRSGLVYQNYVPWQNNDISHIEQTKPIQGDGVWAYDDDKNKAIGVQVRYIGAASNGLFVCEQNDGYIEVYKHVKLAAPYKTLTIEEAETFLTELTKEKYKINL